MRQPGGRAPAPGRLALVQSFINTHYDLEADHGAEVLSSPDALRAWLLAHGLLEQGEAVGPEALERALELREQLRALARGAADLEWLNELAGGAAVEVRFTPSGPRFAGVGPAGALGVLLAITATSVLDGHFSRLKICPGENCGWAFYDHSRNQAGRWCSMAVCGGRAKAQAHYRRRRRAGVAGGASMA